MFVGAPGISFGAIGALWIRFRSKRSPARRLLLEALLLGALLGAIVPLTTRIFGPNSREFLRYVTPVAAITGAICAFLAFHTLKKLGLLVAIQVG
jgi:membrane associated rhomboid family serine protease